MLPSTQQNATTGGGALDAQERNSVRLVDEIARGNIAAVPGSIDTLRKAAVIQAKRANKVVGPFGFGS